MEPIRTYTEPPTFEAVWAALKEVAEMQKENEQTRKENERERKENERAMKESAERLDKQMGKLDRRFGEVVEYIVMPNLLVRFGELGYAFEKAYQNATITDKKNNIFTEIDITLENGDEVMIVEVKSKPSTADIKEHIKRMGKVRAYADIKNDKRKFLAAVAGMVINSNVRNYAHKNGFYVIEPSGATFIINEPRGVYAPRIW